VSISHPSKLDELIEALREIYASQIQLVSQFRGVNREHRLRCNECNRTWKAKLSSVLEGIGCPSCVRGVQRRNPRGKYKFKTVLLEGKSFRVQGYEPQALGWILQTKPTLKAKDIKVDTSGEVPTIQYKIGRRKRTYFPDMYIPKINRIIEVKSIHTLGIKTGKGWRKNQQKAKAVLEAGYAFALLLVKGDRIFLMPKDWYQMDRKDVLAKLVQRDSSLI
jgi:hypothetical protein